MMPTFIIKRWMNCKYNYSSFLLKSSILYYFVYWLECFCCNNVLVLENVDCMAQSVRNYYNDYVLFSLYRLEWRVASDGMKWTKMENGITRILDAIMEFNSMQSLGVMKEYDIISTYSKLKLPRRKNWVIIMGSWRMKNLLCYAGAEAYS